VAAIDVAFILAVLAFGWGLSLATYRLLAKHHGWPMGDLHVSRPGLPVLIGVACMLLAVAFAATRAGIGHPGSGSVIVVFGLAWAVFWTGFLRVGAQSALLLAPGAGLLLLVRWLS
jgi:hypothetical protein